MYKAKPSLIPNLSRRHSPTIPEHPGTIRTPLSAFFKVVLPAVMPGIISGFIMSFTMSLDDFVISYYTTGSDFQTLPLKIFAMTKKTVKPDMYALSSLIFLTVLILLLIVNIGQIKQDRKNKN